ncbi:amidohydrolase family protein [Dactylosporangium sp. AC04546]|uniref:amidohydrolase family protein n=1 Tax=Dactylosporangium sp. AC04546 TaxID=2862460 RepID=UPI001EDD100E|nr:amidohydrolase family protein [Dactylosporangium sp. AC04546]WVK80763.1 amidohydrolase family protein [Dactylosporangium sp. AC04546]
MSRPDPMLLPDPEPRERVYPVISVDDHLHEPPDLFDGRLPSHLQERAPARIEDASGAQWWSYEGNLLAESGLENVAGRDPSSWTRAPLRDDEMRRGSWDINARVADMDIDGVYAHTCFPSGVFGFAGRVLSMSKDRELGLATLRAYNDWHLEYLAGTHPGRIIPMQLVWVTDPAVAAADIRRNAERGFKAATLPDLPQHLGLPRIGDPYWYPVLEALEETQTVVCIHLGAAGWVLDPLPNRERNLDPKLDYTLAALFPASSMVTGIEWTFSGVPARFPNLKVALSEGGIGWVPMAVDRLDYMMDHSGAQLHSEWKSDLSPSETLLHHFYFCMIDNPSNLDAYKMIGSDHIMVETDYPHSDSTWPDTQKLLSDRFSALPGDDAINMAYRTASRLFRHPVPESWLATTAVHG